MSTKESAMLELYAGRLLKACQIANDAVTAGQVSDQLGVSRQTAKKYLEKLVLNGMAFRCIGVHVNRQEKTGYVPAGEW